MAPVKVTTGRYAAGYIRRSSADVENPGAVSRQGQEAAIARTAQDDGIDPASVRVFVDWGMSGGRNDRPEYMRLKADIEAGRVSVVYGLNLSRLGRSLLELLAFVDACEKNGTVLRLAQDSIDTSTPTGRAMLRMLAVLDSSSPAWTGRRRRCDGRFVGTNQLGEDPLQGRHVVVAERLGEVATDAITAGTAVRSWVRRTLACRHPQAHRAARAGRVVGAVARWVPGQVGV